MEEICLAILPVIGFIGGFLSGMLGLGGGVIMLPLLTFVGGIPLKLATGTDLVHVFLASATGMVSHYRSGMVDVRAGLLLGLAGVTGGFGGSHLSVQLSVNQLQYIYLFIVGLAIILLATPLKWENENYIKGNFNKILGIAIGIGIGSLAGLLGVGGGFIIIPLSIYLLKIPLRVAIGTSLLIIFISSIGTIPAKFKVGHINLTITVLVVSGSINGAILGAYISRKLPIRFLRMALISILSLIFMLVGYKAFLG